MTAISVIIPTYNREKFLGRAIRSVLRQTIACSEILVIDDGSTDHTAALVYSLREHSTIPIHFFYQENRGPAAARNLGIHRAQSELVAFLDSDDHWRKDKLAQQQKAMEESPGYLISHTREQWLRGGVHLNQKKKHLPHHGDIFNHCLQLCTVGMSTVMVRKELFATIGLFSPRLPCCEDYDFWLRTSCRYPFLLVDKSLTIKEGGREDQVSCQYRVGMDKLRIHVIMRLLESASLSREQHELALQELQQKCLVYGHGCIKHGKGDEGTTYLNLYKKYQ
ncbi:MAG: glycosyltransferase family 2 protein [Proteobacteria bacterium]|nr:glycosyltransferase family 2 protein [Pseudomonadota bacterium]MBU1650143.1 glycosyltransferase family 2 protein [Pseudomonadota bacterium]MBU1986896.1 glycosyltransferase family 2 protein [Pseudomonadota bacterium]